MLKVEEDIIAIAEQGACLFNMRYAVQFRTTSKKGISKLTSARLVIWLYDLPFWNGGP